MAEAQNNAYLTMFIQNDNLYTFVYSLCFVAFWIILWGHSILTWPKVPRLPSQILMIFGPDVCISKIWKSWKFQLCIFNSLHVTAHINFSRNWKLSIFEPGAMFNSQKFTNKVQGRNISPFQWSSLYISLKKVIITLWKWWNFWKMSLKITKKFVNWSKFDSQTHIQRLLIPKWIPRTLWKFVFCKWSKSSLT